MDERGIEGSGRSVRGQNEAKCNSDHEGSMSSRRQHVPADAPEMSQHRGVQLAQSQRISYSVCVLLGCCCCTTPLLTLCWFCRQVIAIWDIEVWKGLQHKMCAVCTSQSMSTKTRQHVASIAAVVGSCMGHGQCLAAAVPVHQPWQLQQAFHLMQMEADSLSAGSRSKHPHDRDCIDNSTL